MENYSHEDFLPVWQKKVETGQLLKIGIITDTHVHPNRIDSENKSEDAKRALFDEDLTPFQKFNSRMKESNPDRIIHMGDVLEGTNDEAYVGIMGLDLVKEQLMKSEVPIEWLAGNHDLRSVTKEQFMQTLGMDNLNYVVDDGDYRLVFLDASYYPDGRDLYPGGRSIPGYLPSETLLWLKEKLKTDKRVFVFMHQAPFDRRISDLGGKEKSSIENATELRKLLKIYNADAIFNGHIETRFYEEKGGVKYYSLPGTLKSEYYPESYHFLKIDSAEPEVTTFYTDKETGEEKAIDFK
jgi:alkaline phosphatase